MLALSVSLGGCEVWFGALAPQVDKGQATTAPTATATAPAPGATPPGVVAPGASPPSSFDPLPSILEPGPATDVYLAPIGDVPVEVLSQLAIELEAKLDLDVAILRSTPLDPATIDPVRRQYEADELIDMLALDHPRAMLVDGSIVIGVLVEDVYIRDRPDWNWAFGVRSSAGYAVVSTARMGDLSPPVASITTARLRKMILRDIGVLFYDLPLNQDRLSVLFENVLGVDDLDAMTEEFCGSSCPGRADLPGWLAVHDTAWQDRLAG
jgi:predicted Zn-dependent protease